MATPVQIPMNYVEPPDIPEGMTLTEHRCLRPPRAVTRRRRARRGLFAFLRRIV
jgi:hypothetical protein